MNTYLFKLTFFNYFFNRGIPINESFETCLRAVQILPVSFFFPSMANVFTCQYKKAKHSTIALMQAGLATDAVRECEELRTQGIVFICWKNSILLAHQGWPDNRSGLSIRYFPSAIKYVTNNQTYNSRAREADIIICSWYSILYNSFCWNNNWMQKQVKHGNFTYATKIIRFNCSIWLYRNITIMYLNFPNKCSFQPNKSE